MIVVDRDDYERFFSLEDSNNLPDPHILAQGISDDRRSVLAQIEDVLGDLEQRVVRDSAE